MTETKAPYRVAQCPVCKTPVTTVTGEDGTTYTRALYASDRERQQVYAALVEERSRVLVLQAQCDELRRALDNPEVDKCRALLDGAAIEHSGCTLSERVKRLVEREHGYFELGISAAGARNVAVAALELERAEVVRLRGELGAAFDAALRQARSILYEQGRKDEAETELNEARDVLFDLGVQYDGDGVKDRIQRLAYRLSEQRDSARTCAARWKRCAKRALYGDTDVVSTKPTPGRRITSVVVSSRVRAPLIIEELEEKAG